MKLITYLLTYFSQEVVRQTLTPDETKYMSLMIKYNELLKIYNKIWDKVNRSIKRGFHR